MEHWKAYQTLAVWVERFHKVALGKRFLRAPRPTELQLMLIDQSDALETIRVEGQGL